MAMGWSVCSLALHSLRCVVPTYHTIRIASLLPIPHPQWLESAAGELHAARLAYERGQAERRSKAEAEMRATAEEARRAAEQRRREQARRGGVDGVG